MTAKTEARDPAPGDLAALRARVEAATGADRELDGDVFWHLERERATHAYWRASMGRPRALPDDFEPAGLGRTALIVSAPEYSFNIDTALALVARKLPGARVEMKWEPDSYGAAEILTGRNSSTRHLGGYERPDSELPLAILSALLSALDKDQTHAG